MAIKNNDQNTNIDKNNRKSPKINHTMKPNGER